MDQNNTKHRERDKGMSSIEATESDASPCFRGRGTRARRRRRVFGILASKLYRIFAILALFSASACIIKIISYFRFELCKYPYYVRVNLIDSLFLTFKEVVANVRRPPLLRPIHQITITKNKSCRAKLDIRGRKDPYVQRKQTLTICGTDKHN